VLLNSAYTTVSIPALNHTWVDSPRKDFERGADELFDLNTAFRRRTAFVLDIRSRVSPGA
jgi:hypothetical protein